MTLFKSLQTRFVLATFAVTAIAVGTVHTVYITWFSETNFQNVSGRLERALNWYQPEEEGQRDLTGELVECARRFDLSGGAIVRLDRPVVIASIGFPLTQDEIGRWMREGQIESRSLEDDFIIGPWSDHMLACRRVPLPDGMPGVLVLASSMEKELVAQRALQTISIITIVGSALLVLMLSVAIRKRMTGSVQVLGDAIGHVAEGELSHEIDTDLDAELVPLATRYNHMIRELTKYRQAVQDYQQSLEQRIEEAREELRLKEAELMQAAKLASIGELAAGVAHEINNPIQFIMFTAELLKEDVTEPGSAQRVLKILEQSQRCKAIVGDLLEYARSGAGSEVELDINECVRDAVDILRGGMADDGVRLDLQLAEGMPLIRGTSEEMQRALYNVLQNAVQAMEGAGTVSVQTEVDSLEPAVSVVIADSGCGMPPERVGRVFEPFFTTKPVGQGTGLGLSIAYGVVARHRGRIRITSEPGEGTTVHISLPLPREDIGETT